MSLQEKRDHQGDNLLPGALSGVVKVPEHSFVNTGELPDSQDKQKSGQRGLGESPNTSANNNNLQSCQSLMEVKDPTETLKKKGSSVAQEKKFLNKKKKRLVKNKFIEDEAVEEDSEGHSVYSKGDFDDENKDKYEDSFIDDDDIPANKDDIKLYRQLQIEEQNDAGLNDIVEDILESDKDEKPEEKLQGNEIIQCNEKLQCNEKIQNNEKLQCKVKIQSNVKLQGNEILQPNEKLQGKENIDFHYIKRYFSVENLAENEFDKKAVDDCDVFLKNEFAKIKIPDNNVDNDEPIFTHNSIFFIQMITLFSTLFKIPCNAKDMQYDLWRDLQSNDIEDYIRNWFFKLIKNTISLSGTCLNMVLYFICNEPPNADLKLQYNKYRSYFVETTTAGNIQFEILKNPGQTKKIMINVNLENYAEIIKENAEFYKDKSADYDEKLTEQEKHNIEKQKEKDKLYNNFLDECQKELDEINLYRLNNDQVDFNNIENKDKMFESNVKFNCNAFGFVIYMDKIDYYEDRPDLNTEVHFHHKLATMAKGMLFYLSNFMGYKHVNKIIVAHEHGEKNNKCHIQGYIQFYDRIQQKIPPGSFSIADVKDCMIMRNYLIMFQSAKNVHALQNYVKKKDPLVPVNKFLEFTFDRTYTVYNALDKISCKDRKILNAGDGDKKENKVGKNVNEMYNMLMSIPGLDINILKDLCISNNDAAFTKYAISNFEKILSMNHKLNKPPVPDFKWTYPQYALDYIQRYKNDIPGYNNIPKYKFFQFTYDWFKTYCQNNDPLKIDKFNKHRKLGLVVYGTSEIGKSTFFGQWCGDFGDPAKNPYIVYCRNTINWDAFEEKIDTAQLVIFDDCKINPDIHYELLKALFAGQTTYIKSNYIDNKLWSRSCPTIFITNRPDYFHQFTHNDEFKYRIAALAISCFIGPDGEAPERNRFVYVDPGAQQDLDKYEENLENYRKRKNAFFNNYMTFNKYKK